MLTQLGFYFHFNGCGLHNYLAVDGTGTLNEELVVELVNLREKKRRPPGETGTPLPLPP